MLAKLDFETRLLVTLVALLPATSAGAARKFPQSAP
jgi:hypothetical protein